MLGQDSGGPRRAACGGASVSTPVLVRAAVSLALAADVVAVFVALAGLGDIAFAPFVLLVAGGVSVCLAMPAYSVLRRYRRETWLSCIVAGFVVGAAVAALILLLLPVPSSEQIGQETTVVGGVRTAAGWRMYAETVGIVGGIGACAGAVFWAALRLLERAGRWLRLGRFSLTGEISLAVAASWTIFALPSLAMDRSCHNPLRDGRRSIAPALLFHVELEGGEWPRFQDTAERFASAEGWDIDASNDKDKAFSGGRFVNACVEPGTQVLFQGADVQSQTRVLVLVYQPQGGDSWRGPAERLLASIEAGFPGRLRRSLADTEAQTPFTLLPQQ